MRYFDLGKTGAYDMNTSQFEVQINENSRFSVGELPSIRAFNRILDCKIEFKSHVQTQKTGNLFIEFQIDNKGDDVLTASGLSTTEADLWFLNISEHLQLTISTEMLKWFFDNRVKLELEEKSNEKTADDHIGYGLIIPMWRLCELHNTYIQHLNEQRKNEVYRNNKLGNSNLDGNTN